MAATRLRQATAQAYLDEPSAVHRSCGETLYEGRCLRREWHGRPARPSGGVGIIP
jgi:hypothetical protein